MRQAGQCRRNSAGKTIRTYGSRSRISCWKKKKGATAMNNLISVITPAEKNEEYVNTALESLRKQKYTNFEVLLLHSDIDSLKKVSDRAYLDDYRYRFIDTPAGLNVAAARNSGIEKAKGDYIYFLDSDDYISENMLQLLRDNIGDFPVIRG